MLEMSCSAYPAVLCSISLGASHQGWLEPSYRSVHGVLGMQVCCVQFEALSSMPDSLRYPCTVVSRYRVKIGIYCILGW